MNISRLGQASGVGFGTPRAAGKADVRPTATPTASPTATPAGMPTATPAAMPTRGAARVDTNPGPTSGTSPRIASFEESLQSRIDQMAKSGKLSDRQLDMLQDVKEQLSSMMARLDRAFFDGENMDPSASDAMKNILDMTAESLGSILGRPDEPGDGTATHQRQFAYGTGASAADVAGKSLDTMI